MTTIHTIGIDISKSVFHLIGTNRAGRVILRKVLKRSEVRHYLANLPSCLIGIEACGGSNYWARELQGLGHTVKLMDARYVKPYVKGNKNDFNDAEALAEAVRRPTMRFVPIKSVAQQDIQAIHRVRSGLVRQRTAMGNQLRGLLGEYGIVMPTGVASVRRRLPQILEDAENGLSTSMRTLLAELYQRLVDVDASIKQYNQHLEFVQQQDAASTRLRTVVGFGPVIATAMACALGDGTAFKNGRQVAAWLGLVPKQHSTGGKTVLLGISKRGDRYLRTLLIHGARSVVRYADNKDDRLSRWVVRIKTEKGFNIATVALANKLARIAWAMLYRGTDYRAA